MRIQSGITDQYIYFIAVDSTDYVTRETALTTFTVYRSRNGGAATAYTTPTVTEVDATNMPGVYKFLLDEDMTIDAGDDSQEICYHITQASMAPVTRTIELYRPIVTAGATLTVANGAADADIERIQGTVVSTPATAGILDVNVKNIDNDAASASGTVTFPNATLASTTNITAGTITTVTTTTTATNVTTVNGLAAGVITAASIATGAIDADSLAADAVTEIQSGLATAANLATVAGYLDTEIAAILADTNELQVDWVDGGRLDLILDARASQTSVDDLPTNAELATALGTADDATLAAIAALNDLSSADVTAAVPTANANADALLDRAAGVETGLTPREAWRLVAAACAGKASGLATATAVYRNSVADTKDRITATVDADGNRTAITYDLT